MSEFKQKPGFGSIFKNDYKTADNQPDYKGKILLQDGTEQQIAPSFTQRAICCSVPSCKSILPL